MNEHETIEELKNILQEEKKPPEEIKKEKWPEFIEGAVLNFFNKHKIEKLTVEDGNGNKAKFTRTKDSGIRIEYSSTILI